MAWENKYQMSEVNGYRSKFMEKLTKKNPLFAEEGVVIEEAFMYMKISQNFHTGQRTKSANDA